MNARVSPQGNPHTAPPRFDRKFIEDHQLVERYLEGKLPFKGAQDLENWCRANPEYLNELKLSDRAHASLKLLEASGRPQDLREPEPPWWKSTYVLIGLSVAAGLTLLAFWAMLGKYLLLRGELDDTRALPIPGARSGVTRSAPQLLDLHIDLAYTDKQMQFRMFVDKEDQGRALILNNLLKDSNGELRMTINSTGLAAGVYDVRIEALPFKGSPIPLGWLKLDVR